MPWMAVDAAVRLSTGGSSANRHLQKRGSVTTGTEIEAQGLCTPQGDTEGGFAILCIKLPVPQSTTGAQY